MLLMLVLGVERRAHLLLIMIIHHVLHHRLGKPAHVDVYALLETVQSGQMFLRRRRLAGSRRSTRKDVKIATFSHKCERLEQRKVGRDV